MAPQVVSTQFVTEIEANPLIRKRVFEFEEKLSLFFNTPFRTIPLPDNLDPSLPRFESQSIHGHSILQVSGTRLTMNTNYKENYHDDIGKISEYIFERVPVFNDLLKVEKKLFIALIFELAFEVEQGEINNLFKTHSGLTAITEDTIDAHLLYSKPFANKYYINVKCSKFINEQFKFEENKLLKQNQKYGITVNLDINSRLHQNKGHNFDDNLVSDISDLIFALIKNNDLSNYLSGEINE